MITLAGKSVSMGQMWHRWGQKARQLMARGGTAGQSPARHPGAGPARAAITSQAEAICPAAATPTAGISSGCDS